VTLKTDSIILSNPANRTTIVVVGGALVGSFLHHQFALPPDNPFLQAIAFRAPAFHLAFTSSHHLSLFTTPMIVPSAPGQPGCPIPTSHSVRTGHPPSRDSRPALISKSGRRLLPSARAGAPAETAAPINGRRGLWHACSSSGLVDGHEQEVGGCGAFPSSPAPSAPGTRCEPGAEGSATTSSRPSRRGAQAALAFGERAAREERHEDRQGCAARLRWALDVPASEALRRDVARDGGVRLRPAQGVVERRTSGRGREPGGLRLRTRRGIRT
jgi:hypothetical protein